MRTYFSADDIHARVARRLMAEGLTPVLDVGCGEGELARHLPCGAWIGVDSSREMLARAPEPNFRGETAALAFEDASFGSVALLYVLYHLREPRLALAEHHPHRLQCPPLLRLTLDRDHKTSRLYNLTGGSMRKPQNLGRR